MNKNKRCNKCNTDKPISEFQLNTRNSWCRECNKAYQKQYKEANKNAWAGYVRKEFDILILTDDEMEIEMKSYKPLDSTGVNALRFEETKFEELAKNKNLNAKPKQKYNGYRTFRHSPNEVSNLLNINH